MGWRDRFDDEDDDDIDIGRGRQSTPAPGSAGWAVASFFISILDAVFLGALFLFAVMISLNQNAPLPDNDPKVVLIGFGFLAGLAFAVFGAILGFVGIGQRSGVVFAILGIVFNVLIVLGVLGMLIFGAVMGP